MMFSMTPEDFDAVVKVHLYGTFNTMHHASAYWRNESKEGRQPRASIINTVSSAGLQGQASQINYGAAKAGIAAMTIIASLELEPLRRARQLHRPRRRHPHGRAGDEDRGQEPRGLHRVRAHEPGQLGARRRVARLRRVAARHRPGAPPRRQQPRALPARGRWASSSSPPTRTATPKQWDPADIGRILNRYDFQSENPGIDAQRAADRSSHAEREEQTGSQGRDRRRGAVRHRAGRHQDAVRAALPGRDRAPSPTPASPRPTSTASARAAWACSRRSRSPSTSVCGPRGSTAPASAASTWEFMVGHATAAILAGPRRGRRARRTDRRPAPT